MERWRIWAQRQCVHINYSCICLYVFWILLIIITLSTWLLNYVSFIHFSFAFLSASQITPSLLLHIHYQVIYLINSFVYLLTYAPNYFLIYISANWTANQIAPYPLFTSIVRLFTCLLLYLFIYFLTYSSAFIIYLHTHSQSKLLFSPLFILFVITLISCQFITSVNLSIHK